MARSSRRDPEKKRGGQRMLEFGYHSVQCWFDAAEYPQIKEAARAAGLPVATFVRRVAFEAALAGAKPTRY